MRFHQMWRIYMELKLGLVRVNHNTIVQVDRVSWCKMIFDIVRFVLVKIIESKNVVRLRIGFHQLGLFLQESLSDRLAENSIVEGILHIRQFLRLRRFLVRLHQQVILPIVSLQKLIPLIGVSLRDNPLVNLVDQIVVVNEDLLRNQLTKLVQGIFDGFHYNTLQLNSGRLEIHKSMFQKSLVSKLVSELKLELVFFQKGIALVINDIYLIASAQLRDNRDIIVQKLAS